MKKFAYLFSILVLVTAVAGVAGGQELMVEHFNYSTGQLTNASGGANVSGGNWVSFSGTGNFIPVTAGSLSYPSYLGPTGNKINIVATAGSAEDAYRAFATQTSGTVYAAFLVNVTDTTGLPLNSSTTGDYFAGFLPSTSTTILNARVSIRTGSVAGTYQLGLRASTTNPTATFSTTDLTPGNTTLVVFSYQIVAGAANDVVNMWINPTVGGAEPAADITQTSAGDLADVTRFFVRQGNLQTPNASIDTIRVGTTWASVADLPDISVMDARVAEPATGSTNMVFTVVLSAAPTSAVSVDFTTADEPAGPGKATSTGPTPDYTTTSGTINFAAGERIKTISVPVLADTDNAEPDETFLVNLSNPVNGIILDGQAVGTITAANPAGTFIISELRTSGPGGAGDDFVELYNNTDVPLTVAATDASAGYGLFTMGVNCDSAPVLIGVIPNGTIIPARGHYLIVGSAYSLGNYGGTGAAAGNLTMASDIQNDGNVGVFSTSDLGSLSTINRLDAVGFGINNQNVCNLLREGSTLPAVFGTTSEHSFFRKGGEQEPDKNDNAADFQFADTQGTFIAGVTQLLGAPGPQNIASPIGGIVSGGVQTFRLDSSQPTGAAPNFFFDNTSDPPNNSTFGTISIRRRVTNNTGAPVTRLRFRIYHLSTFPSPGGGMADLRARTSGSVGVTGVNDATTCTAAGAGVPPCSFTVTGTTLEQPPTQPNGGGFNSTYSEGTISVGTPLANGASTMVQFLFGIQQPGTFALAMVVEALPGGGGEVIMMTGSTASGPTAANGTISGQILDSGGNPLPGTVINLNGTQNRKMITDAIGRYSFDNVETGGLYTVTPARANFGFSPGALSFSQLGINTEASFTATPLSQTRNPMGTPEYFVRQHYLDFLGREPDEAGFNFWSDQILACGGDTACTERRTINVSAAYFQSVEFQRTGGLVDRLYRASYGRNPLYGEFVPDRAAIAQNVIVGKTGWENLLLGNETSFVNAFVTRDAFRSLHDGLSNAQYVNTLMSNTGVGYSPAERDALVGGLSAGTLSRAEVLHRIATNEDFAKARFNAAFVMMEYFGYLRRDPDPSGYDFWLNKLNQFGGNFERAEMVKAFINSGEYRARFAR